MGGTSYKARMKLIRDATVADFNRREADKAAENLRSAADRMRKHLAAIRADESFGESPYYVAGRCGFWNWDELALRLDQAALAAAYVNAR